MNSKLRTGLILAACGFLAACAAPKPTPPTVLQPVPLLIASPEHEAAPSALEARLTVAKDAQMLLHFEVEPDGSVQNPEVLMSKLTPDHTAAVLAAFAELRFHPYVESGKPVARAFIFPLFFGPDAISERTRFLCLHQQEMYLPASRCDIVQSGMWRIYRVTPPYPESLLGAPVTGAVTLSFDVDAGGSPSNVKVVKSVPPGVFDTSAVVALQQWYFEAPASASTVPPQHATVTLHFTPPASHK